MSERPTLELSADQVQAEPDGGAFLITMPGDPCPGSRTSCPPFTRAMCSYGGGPHPPSVLVALNQPCPTCGGEGEVEIKRDVWMPCGSCGIADEDVTEANCHLNGSGRLVFDLKTPCGCRRASPYLRSDCICGFGFLSYRVWLDPEWGILPIISAMDERWNSEDRSWLPVIVPWPAFGHGQDGKEFVLHEQNAKQRTVIVPPAARPGDYVARAVKATE